jgi:hypothetical protein
MAQGFALGVADGVEVGRQQVEAEALARSVVNEFENYVKLNKKVSPEVVWAAIDCAGAYAVGGPGRGEVVLGRMTAEIRRLPAEGEQCVVVAWPLGEEGRKAFAGTALYGEGGRLLGVARATWIEPSRPATAGV